MLQYREGTFETNSSSSHNVVIVEDSMLEKWKNGEVFYVEDGGQFVNKFRKDEYMDNLYGRLVIEYADSREYQDEIVEAIKENRLSEYVKERIEDEDWYVDTYDMPLSFEEWQDIWDDRELESDEHTYTTSSGETIHIFCQFGYNG